MQYEHNELMSAAREYIGLMKESGLGYFRIKNDKFEIELGEKHPHMMPLPMQFPPQAGAPASAAERHELADSRYVLRGSVAG